MADAGERPDTKRSLRVARETTRKSMRLHSASDVAMRRSSDRAVIPAEARTTIESELPGRRAPWARRRPSREGTVGRRAVLSQPRQRLSWTEDAVWELCRWNGRGGVREQGESDWHGWDCRNNKEEVS